MPTYKLTYFNGKGRAELARWIFAVQGQKYEDCRLEREQWLKIKAGIKKCIYICHRGYSSKPLRTKDKG